MQVSDTGEFEKNFSDDLESESLNADYYEEHDEVSDLHHHEQILGSQNSNKNSFGLSKIFLFIFVVVAASGYFYITYKNDLDSPPVVSLNFNVPETDSRNVINETAKKAEEQRVSEPIPEAQNKITGQAILTPLPTDMSNNSVKLVPLTSENDDSEIMAADDSNLENTNYNDTSASLDILEEEEDLLSKTEESPDINSTENLKTTKDTKSTSDKRKNQDRDSQKNDSPEVKNDSQTREPSKKETTSHGNTKTLTREDQIDKKPKIEDSPAPEKVTWEIKGINPQGAVIHNKKSGETRSIEPGNIVEGLGRIKSIRKEDGKWIVNGTLGNATQ